MDSQVPILCIALVVSEQNDGACPQHQKV